MEFLNLLTDRWGGVGGEGGARSVFQVQLFDFWFVHFRITRCERPESDASDRFEISSIFL